MRHWHEVLPKKFSMIEDFNHGFSLKQGLLKSGKTKTLEIGAGLGAHLAFENLDIQDYTANELRSEMAEDIKKNFPKAQVLIGDIQEGLNIESHSFDRVLAIHVLEHLPNLPKALKEVKRLMKPDGVLSVVIPCEGGTLYSLAREISAKRIFVKRYKMSYDWFIKSEHVSTASEILTEIKKDFYVSSSKYFPFLIPSRNANLVIGLNLKIKNS